MWLFLGPIVIRRAAPRLVKGIIRDVAGLTLADVEASSGDMFKAMTKKQGDTFAQAMYGAMGKIVQSAPTEELEALAKAHGFSGVSDAAQKLGGLVGAGSGGGVSPNLLSTLGALNGGQGKKGGFSSIVELITALNALSQLGGVSGMSPVGGGGNPSPHRPSFSSSSHVSGW